MQTHATSEEAVTARMDALQADLNEGLLALEAVVRGMRPAMEQMARHLDTAVQLLPRPSDGPIARLRDTLTAT